MAFEFETAGADRQAVVEIRIGIDVLGGPVGARAELTRVDHVIVAGCALVTVEPRGGRAMADDAGTRNVTLPRLLDEGRHPARMVDVTVRVNRSIYAIGRELAHECYRLRLAVIDAGVDEDQAFLRPDGGEIRQPSVEHDAGGDFLEIPGRDQRMLRQDGQLAVPEFLGLFSDCAHDSPSTDYPSRGNAVATWQVLSVLSCGD